MGAGDLDKQPLIQTLSRSGPTTGLHSLTPPPPTGLLPRPDRPNPGSPLSSPWVLAWAAPSTWLPSPLSVKAPPNLRLHQEAFLVPSLHQHSPLCPINSTLHFMGPSGFSPRQLLSSRGAVPCGDPACIDHRHMPEWTPGDAGRLPPAQRRCTCRTSVARESAFCSPCPQR